MGDLVEAAKKKRAELVKELEKLDHFLEIAQSLALDFQLDEANKAGTSSPSTMDQKPVDDGQKEADREAEASDDAAPKRTRVTDNPKPKTVVKEAVAVIRERGRPMSRREVWEALRDRGTVVRGADPVKALGTMLWRSGKNDLIQLEGHGYWVRDEDYEPARYQGDLF